jgi:Zn-dependent protease
MDLQRLAIVVPPLLLAITFHEAMHGYAAYRLGDPTAKLLGRLTLNPIAHIDPLGSVIIPALLFVTNASFLFGWAKPVPVNYFRLRNPKQDMMWVAAAGPLTNLTLAALSGLFYKLLVLLAQVLASPTSPLMGFFAGMAVFSVKINVLLALFNLIPVPPLDGGRILVGILPREQAAAVSRVEPFGMFIVVGLILLNPFGLTSLLWRSMSLLTRMFLGI